VPEAEIRRFNRLLFVIYFLEVGLLLIVVPWSVFWERNFFAESNPGLSALLQNNYIRGAVSGLGVVNIFAGFVELAGIMLGRRPRPPDPGSVVPSPDTLSHGTS
jgi:hypothetical protein